MPHLWRRALAVQNGCAALHGKPVDFPRLLRLIESTAAPAAGAEA
jgi:hypothetical protein